MLADVETLDNDRTSFDSKLLCFDIVSGPGFCFCFVFVGRPIFPEDTGRAGKSSCKMKVFGAHSLQPVDENAGSDNPGGGLIVSGGNFAVSATSAERDAGEGVDAAFDSSALLAADDADARGAGAKVATAVADTSAAAVPCVATSEDTLAAAATIAAALRAACGKEGILAVLGNTFLFLAHLLKFM